MPTTLTLVELVHYQPDDQPPITMETRASIRLLTEEQPYVRHLTVGEEWEKLDTGWIRACSSVVIKNGEGRFLQRIPSQAEQNEANARILEIGFADGLQSNQESPILGRFLIRPQLHNRFEPLDLGSMRIRCQKGKAKFSVIVFPK